MATLAATAWLQPGIYYALKYPNVDKKQGLSNKQHDVSLTRRFDLEGHCMAGTTGLLNPLQYGLPPANPDRRWATVFF
jgi:hypothetical protein